MSRCDSAATVSNTRELFPEPDTPVNTVSRRFGSSTLTSLRLFTRAPWTRIRSWLSAVDGPLVDAVVFAAARLAGAFFAFAACLTAGRLAAACLVDFFAVA